MIQLSGAGKRFGHKLLFEGTDWLITSKDRIGLVGANGTGKSTLMKILGGMENLDYGSISVAKGISSGYLPQDGLTLEGRTVFAECIAVFSELRAMEQEMEDLTRRMSELDTQSNEYTQVADRFHRIDHEFRTRDGYAIEAQVGTASALAAVLDRSCRDCHSNATVWPPVAKVAPLSWVMARAVAEGRKAVNFSEWGGYSPAAQRTLLSASCEDTSNGKMPGPYTLVRPETRLSPQDVETICTAARQAEANAADGRRQR